MALKTGWFVNALQWSRARFRNVWSSNYPWYWYVFDMIGGIIVGLIFVFVYETQSSIALRVGWFFAAAAVGFLCFWAFSYGVVRARNAWTKKRD